MSLAPGTRLGHYELVGPLGSGGMGEVWRARDMSLDREVAIKVLPMAFAQDEERLARFEREAKLLASLNHANIAGIFGFHAQDGVRFLAMELVPGEDLAERLKQGPLPVSEALDVARQIAEALEAAHEQGIVHRDLKPANVKLTPDGKVKVLDFGLAKALETATSTASGRDAAMSPTITSLGTVAGVILGTAAYMSPEQARGKPVDKRADIWAFGCVLYEMLSGRRPFDGETVSDTLAAVLAKDADWSALPAATPAKVRHLIQRCLDKDAKHRVRDVGDARIELEETLADRTTSGRVRVAEEKAAPPPTPSTSRWILGAIGGALVGALAVWLGVGRTSPPPSGGVVRLDLDVPADIRATQFRVIPDGSGIVVFGAPRATAGQAPPPFRLYLRRFATGTMAVIPGTQGCTPNPPVISGDSREIAFGLPGTAGSQQFNLVRVPLDGSAPPFTIARANPRWTTGGYLNDGDMVAIEDGTSLVRIPASGRGPGPPIKIDLAGEPGRIRMADLALPGDNAILLHTVAYSEKGWYYRTGVLDLKTARISYLLDDGGFPAYDAATRQIVFSRGDTLLAVGFDAKTLKLTGSPVPITSGLRTEYGFQPAEFRMSNDGVLVHMPGGRTAEGRRLGVVDAAGNLTPLSDDGHAFQRVSAGSADGRRIVATITNGQGIDELWTGEIDRPGLQRIAAVAGADLITPLSMRDGRTVVFGQVGRNANDGIYVKVIDDATPPRRIASLPPDEIQTTIASVTPDGTGLVVVRGTRDRENDIFFLPIPPAGGVLSEFTPILSGPGDERGGRLSPDGRWIVYSSDDSGRPEVYIAAFHGSAPIGDARRVTTSGGFDPYWGADGRSLRFQDPGGRIMSVTVTTTPTLSTGPPVMVYDSRKLNVFQAEVLPDGRQLVQIRGQDETDEIQRLTVVLGFTQELAEKTKTVRSR
ncbi:MAG TPA: protein kinase [Candidatus Polarisedimenticolaceae bacterium]|nr:protein kinase [Candidatus Polarisedimenticolaceae bacterium]